ncbi:hypothetical protein PVT71_12400 [Salipiger sp. H15]|uniref:Uncharacterized protein n=1 Tax=Alloyangia sp. H15 TaxID=3029062 RepID=A0AAU8AGE6_9RHOB
MPPEGLREFLELWRDSIPPEDGRSEDWIGVNAALRALDAAQEETHLRRVASGRGSGAQRAQDGAVWRSIALGLAQAHCKGEANVSTATRRVLTRWRATDAPAPAYDTVRRFLGETKESWG